MNFWKTLILLVTGFGLFHSCDDSSRYQLECLEQAETFEFEYVGFISTKSATYTCFQKLSKKASLQFMDSLFHSSHSSSITKAYAFWHLSKHKRSQEILGLLKKNLHENTKVQARSLDILFETTLSDIYIEIAREYLTAEDKKQLKAYVLEKNLIELNYYKSLLSDTKNQK